jgi:hypothetical protein
MSGNHETHRILSSVIFSPAAWRNMPLVVAGMLNAAANHVPTARGKASVSGMSLCSVYVSDGRRTTACGTS